MLVPQGDECLTSVVYEGSCCLTTKVVAPVSDDSLSEFRPNVFVTLIASCLSSEGMVPGAFLDVCGIGGPAKVVEQPDNARRRVSQNVFVPKAENRSVVPLLHMIGP